MYVLTLMDWYSVAFSLMIISFFEAIVIAWVYGEETFPFPRQSVEEIKFLQRCPYRSRSLRRGYEAHGRPTSVSLVEILLEIYNSWLHSGKLLPADISSFHSGQQTTETFFLFSMPVPPDLHIREPRPGDI